uniref:diuretic hormone 44 isoform X1 n=1 Tax=Osmia lignaria TaxID=473952 RepID=UPI0014791EB0|nr:diuretic hormone 44 isoform X1 [Osmia lignaria]XP_034189992.1 diuretic hormone 44 isoform X1 [Osmia lignaria]
MTFMNVLIFLLFVTIVRSRPMSYSTYDEKELSRDNSPFLLLVDHRIPDLENEMFDSGNDPGSTVVRTKRIGSLSIVDSLDVLRERVLLELARRKALQDQRQIDANRRILESIGKRSLPVYNGDRKNGMEYMIEHERKNQNVTPERITGGFQNWLQRDDSVFRERQDGPTRRVQANELHLL